MFLLSLTIVTIAGFKTKQLNIAQSCLCRLNWKACLSTDGYTTEIQFHVASSRKNKNALSRYNYKILCPDRPKRKKEYLRLGRASVKRKRRTARWGYKTFAVLLTKSRSNK